MKPTPKAEIRLEPKTPNPSHALRPVKSLGTLVCGIALLAGLTATAQTLAPDFAGSYSVRDLGAAGDVPGAYGGIVFKAGASNVLLVAGDAGNPTAKIYQIHLTRDTQNHITAFATTASYVADAPGIPPEQPLDVQGGIGGGLAYGPGGVLFYTSQMDEGISQIPPGATGPTKQTRLRDLGMSDRPDAVLLVPPGFPGAGTLKVLTRSSGWYDVPFAGDGAGTYTLSAPTKSIEIVSYASGLAFVHGNQPGFGKDSVLIPSDLDDRVVTYQVDAAGDPIASTLRDFLTDFYLVRGATVDPVTGDILLASGDGNRPRIVLAGQLAVAPMQVQITSPTNNSSFTAPATLYISADATEAGGTVQRVEFYVGSTRVGSDDSLPFGAPPVDEPAGDYTLTAVAFDGGGNATTSAPVHISVVNDSPVVTLVYPTNNTVLGECSDLTLVAQVTPGNGDIAAVEFLDGAANLGVSHSAWDFAPYRWTVPDIGAGTRTFSVTVTDKNGLTGRAVATNVVVQPLPPNTLKIHRHQPDQLKFCFRGVEGSNYVWETTAGLSKPQWTPWLTNTAPAGRWQVTTPFNSDTPQGFFRVRRP